MVIHTIKEGFTHGGQAYDILIELPEAVSAFELKQEDLRNIIREALEASRLALGGSFKPLNARFIVPLNGIAAPSAFYRLDSGGERDLSGIAIRTGFCEKTIAEFLKTMLEILRGGHLVVQRGVE